VGLQSLTEQIDTTTGGRLIFQVFGALGQLERDLIPSAHAPGSRLLQRVADMANAGRLSRRRSCDVHASQTNG
jgi:hypothetical protein